MHMRARRLARFSAALATSALLITAGLVSATTASAAPNPVSGSVRTTVNEGVDGTGHCQNGNPNVNCNIYDGKQFVWLSGQPLASGLSDGDYMFAVLVPGGQPNVSDTSLTNPKLLSTDSWTDRVFSVSNGVLSYSGPHTFDSNRIRLAPYNDTTNPGGVYILAVCSLADRDTSADPGPGVDPSSCKYDAFKVQSTPQVQLDAPVVTKDAEINFNDTFTWDIQKDVDKTLVEQSGTDATFHYTVTVHHDAGTPGDVTVTGTIDVFNPNAIPLPHVNVTDQLSDSTVCDVTGGSDVTLDPGDNLYPYECHLSAVPLSVLDNTASASWAAVAATPTMGGLDSGTASFTFVNIASTENDVDNCVAVDDSYAGYLGTVCVGDDNPTVFHYDRDVTGTPGTCTTYDNTATFTTNTTGTTDSASQETKLCVGENLTVDKTATPAFMRTYNWNISKAVDKTKVITSANTATFNYTVKAWQTGFSDSGWQVTGSITVTNPNDWEDIPLTGVTDAISNGGTCSITSGDPTGTVPAGGTVTLGYTCTYASAPSPKSFTNTATAMWDAGAAFTPDGSASGTATGVFGAPTGTTNKTIHVTDTYAGDLGTVTATDSTPFASGEFTYSRTVDVPRTGCLTYDNTATITETGQNASTSVQACRAQNTGGFTMGYWTNKNGQKVIGDKYVAMCTKLAMYPTVLNGLPSPCTANALKTYVTNVITAANASGDGAPMFKGQFLATALSVTNTPALGGTGIIVDSAIFGVGCMSVNDLLAFGNTNYATLSLNKTTFMAVKSVYDDINNNRAYTCMP